MKIKEGFVYREIMGQGMIVPTGSASIEFSGMVKLNETGALIWKSISNGEDKEEILAKILSEYSVSEDEAIRSIENFITKMQNLGFIE